MDWEEGSGAAAGLGCVVRRVRKESAGLLYRLLVLDVWARMRLFSEARGSGVADLSGARMDMRAESGLNIGRLLIRRENLSVLINKRDHVRVSFSRRH